MRVCLVVTVAFLLVAGSYLSADDPGNTLVQKKDKQKPKSEATPPEAIDVLPGFKIDLLHTANPATEGSWICMTKDHLGRLIISGQQGQPMLRVTIADGKVKSLDKLNLPFSGAMGLLCAFDSLYVNGIGKQGFGLYRCKDTKGTDQYDDIQLLKKFDGGGEHGPHGVVLGPDNKIYIMNGNHTKLPEGLAKDSPHRNFAEDFLHPRQWDGNGHATGILAPGGYVVRTDEAGKRWELMLAGFRNAYDIAFNTDGELFTFDSDMEWDWGLPWYRPIRINHCTSAADFGWRSGTGKWPDYYFDSLGAVVNVGVGSPTGVSNGIGAKFPTKYQKAIYALDWTYGRILAVHLQPNGSSYTGTFENFVAPKGLKGNGPRRPLNVTDAVIGNDGALYFTTGGRNTQGALYRVSYVGEESTAPAKLENVEGAEQRKLRRKLEAYHGKQDPQAIATAWPYLGSNDRALQYAARVAIESQPVEQWKAKALAETDANAALASLLALARSDAKTQPELLTALEKFPLDKLTDVQKLHKLRVLMLTLIRQGQPSLSQGKKIVAELEAQFPSRDEMLNREMVQVMVSLHSTKLLPKALKHMAEAKLQEDQLHYVFHLRTLPIGFWTLEQRKEYLTYLQKDRKKLPPNPELVRWFEEAGRGYSTGASYSNYMRNIFREAVTYMSESERQLLDKEIKAIDAAAAPTYVIKPRPVVRAWKMEEITPQLAKIDQGRNFARGQEAFRAAQCANCHRFGEIGGAVGPDLTAISARFNRRDILESILEPSKVISEQYQNLTITTLAGKIVNGRLMDETADKVVIQPDPLAPDRIEVKKSDIESRTYSKISPMPANLVDVLTAEEILDLLAYLESSGRKNYRAFQK